MEDSTAVLVLTMGDGWHHRPHYYGSGGILGIFLVPVILIIVAATVVISSVSNQIHIMQTVYAAKMRWTM